MDLSDTLLSQYLVLHDEKESIVPTNVLGAINYSDNTDASSQHLFPCASVPIFRREDNVDPHERADGQSDSTVLTEYWTCNRPVKFHTEKQWQICQSKDYLFASIQYVDQDHDLASLTQEHYLHLFALLEKSGYTHLLRVWNFIPRINEVDADQLERYRSFSLGRAKAFDSYFDNMESRLPAATGIGTFSGDNTIVVLASRKSEGITHLENPLQTPAYRYPKQYGPRPPSFARGTSYFCKDDNTHTIYISGTASIQSSDTLHQGDIEKQFEIILVNIATLISSENLAEHSIRAGYTLADVQSVKVYFRHQKDLATLQILCGRAFSASDNVVYLHSDICRSDLDVELEGIIKVGVPNV